MIKVYMIESERGWGSKIDEVKEFPTREEARGILVVWAVVLELQDILLKISA